MRLICKWASSQCLLAGNADCEYLLDCFMRQPVFFIAVIYSVATEPYNGFKELEIESIFTSISLTTVPPLKSLW